MPPLRSRVKEQTEFTFNPNGDITLMISAKKPEEKDKGCKTEPGSPYVSPFLNF